MLNSINKYFIHLYVAKKQYFLLNNFYTSDIQFSILSYEKIIIIFLK